MDAYTKDWLDRWVREKVIAAPFQQQKRLAIETLAPACLIEAMKAGITRRELELTAKGSLVDYLESAIEDKMDVEVRKNRPVG